MPKEFDSGRKCEICGGPITHRVQGQGRHKSRYCSSECSAEAARVAYHKKHGRRPIRRIKPPKAD